MAASFPLIVIVGPTASGKTALAVEIAKKYNGEIICADSRTIYKEFDIGTAKPTPENSKSVPHWGIDLVAADEPFSASAFKQYADQKITEIRDRGRLPLLVGGTGLYINSVLYDYSFGAKPSEGQRRLLEKKSLEELTLLCEKNNITLPENNKNKRYVIRAIENNNQNNSGENTIVRNAYAVGITTEKDELMHRIVTRNEQLFEYGVVEEAIILGKKYGWDCTAMTGNIYRVAKLYYDGSLDIAKSIEKASQLDWQLAKRQLTYFKRDKNIQWHTRDDVEAYVTSVLSSDDL